jgi:exodeoxyribonuclease V alpha subunit
MLDLLLANKLVRAVPPGAHLLLVGDVDQLPSVGAGQVLRDLLTEGSPIPHVRLTQVFRQASRSGVVTNAHRINAGSSPQVRGLDDFFLFSTDDAEEAARLTVDVVVRRIPARFGLDPRRDVQVLTPVHRGPAGAAALNELLQDALTPAQSDRAEKRFGGRVFRVGDKVSQIRNAITTRARTGSSTAPRASSGPSTPSGRRSPSSPTRTRPSTTTSASSTSWCTPTPSPSTAPRAASTPAWSSR